MSKDICKSKAKNITPLIKCQEGEGGSLAVNLENREEFYKIFSCVEHDALEQSLHSLMAFHQAKEPDDKRKLEKATNCSISKLHKIGVSDPIELMLLQQMIITFDLFNTSSKKANTKNQLPERFDDHIKNITKLSKVFLEQVKGLNAYKNQGQQKVKVEHVHISEGGQAVFGDIHSTKTGGGKK